MEDLLRIKQKVKKYKDILKNTKDYRKAWQNGLKDLIVTTLVEISNETGMPAEVEVRDNVENMEVIVYNLGRTTSGIYEKVDEKVKKPMIKSNGALLYQQLFNGKVMIVIMLPTIEGYGQQQPPKTLEILRPQELKKGFIYRHVETFLNDVTEWEDYDDDAPQQKIGFSPIGFNNSAQLEMEGEEDEEN